MGALRKKAAIVTGGGTGIGAAVARRFATEGAAVTVLDVNAGTASSTVEAIRADGGEASFETCDISRIDQVTKAVHAVIDRCQRIDILVNCAGIYDAAAFLDIDPVNWERVVGVDLNGTFLISQAVARTMVEHAGGAIVCIASIDGHVAEVGEASYNAAKAGVIALVKSAAIELARYGIRINSVSPGYVDTAMIASWAGPGLLDYMNNSFARVPIRRLIRPEEIAAAVLFLCSDEASAITGTDLIVDGGTLANSYCVETLPTGE